METGRTAAVEGVSHAVSGSRAALPSRLNEAPSHMMEDNETLNGRRRTDKQMKIRISEIGVNQWLRKAAPEKVQELADSIETIGLLNPIAVDREYTLIAGLHRLEAAKQLGWLEIECTVCDLQGIQAELAEIDENLVRNELNAVESGNLLLRRKEIYETLHPETKKGISQAISMHLAQGHNVSAPGALTSKSFVLDTAAKLGVSKRVIAENLQLAKDLTPETKEIIQNASEKFRKKDMLKLARLPPEQQEEAARQFAALPSKGGRKPPQSSEQRPTPPAPHQKPKQNPEPEPISAPAQKPMPVSAPEPEPRPMPPPAEAPANIETKPEGPAREQPAAGDPPFLLPVRHFNSLAESVAFLKDPDKDCTCTPDIFLADFTEFVKKVCKDIEWYRDPFYAPAYPGLTEEQLSYLRRQMDSITAAADEFYQHVKGVAKYEQQI